MYSIQVARLVPAYPLTLLPMRLGFDAKRLFHNATGLGNYSRTLVANLRTFFPASAYTLFSPKLSSQAFAQPFLSPDYERITPKQKTGWRSWGMARAIDREAIDVFHGLSNEIPFAQTRAATGVTLHDLIFKHLPATYRPADRLIYDVKFRFACRNANKIVAISEATRQDIVQHYRIHPDRIEVHYQACDPVFYEENPALAPPLPPEIGSECILSVGSIIARKNLLLLVRALSQLPRSLRPKVAVIGQGKAYAQEVRREITRLGLNNHFFWYPAVNDTRTLRAWYQAAMCTVYPSFFEGFGLPVAESLLSGTPVITSDRSSLPEAAGPGALLIDPHDSGQLAHALERLLTDNSLRHQLAEAGEAYARTHFSPQTTANRMMDLYQRLR